MQSEYDRILIVQVDRLLQDNPELAAQRNRLYDELERLYCSDNVLGSLVGELGYQDAMELLGLDDDEFKASPLAKLVPEHLAADRQQTAVRLERHFTSCCHCRKVEETHDWYAVTLPRLFSPLRAQAAAAAMFS